MFHIVCSILHRINYYRKALKFQFYRTVRVERIIGCWRREEFQLIFTSKKRNYLLFMNNIELRYYLYCVDFNKYHLHVNDQILLKFFPFILSFAMILLKSFRLISKMCISWKSSISNFDEMIVSIIRIYLINFFFRQ